MNLNASSISGTGKTKLSEHVSNSKNDEVLARFPRLQDCAHFHYEYTEFGPLRLRLVDEEDELKPVIG